MNDHRSDPPNRLRRVSGPVARLATAFLVPILCTGAALAEGSPGDALGHLVAGGHVLMIRHALAPGNGDPPDFRIGDCDTQRNLDHRGRDQARAIGDWLRARGIPRAEVYSSQWCRCLETARLMGIGVVEALPALNSFYEQPEMREPNLRALRAFLDRRPSDGLPTVLVTHFVTIAAIAGSGVGSGEGVVVEIVGEGRYRARGELTFEP